MPISSLPLRLTSGAWMTLPRAVCLLLLSLLAASAIGQEDPLKAALKTVPDKPMAPDFTLTDMQGKSHNLSDFRGKAVFVHFWSVYCPHCRREIPTFEQMYELYHARKKAGKVKDAVFLAINPGEAKEKIVEWAQGFDNPPDLGEKEDLFVLLDTDKAVTKRWKIWGLPSTYLLDTEGHILAYAVGEREWNTPHVLEQIWELLGE